MPFAWAAAVALIGAVETAWLTLNWLAHGHVPCLAGARMTCEALFLAAGAQPLGVPLPVWGHAGYAVTTLTALAAAVLVGAGAARARNAFTALAIGMALVSVFLMARMLGLGAFCAWCLLSAGLSLTLGVIAAVTAVSRGTTWPAPAAGVLLAAAMVALTLAGSPRPAPTSPAAARRQHELARHLAASGAHFYGVWWCVGCREQKDLFGGAAAELPYVECSRVPPPAGVTEYPTWEIAGRRITGVQPLDTLAARSGFVER